MFRALERIMAMDEAAWQRHANPWSVFTRFAVLPLLALAVWSREWIGAGSLVPIALVVLWTWCNPRAFGPPTSTDNWASKGVQGERLFLARKSQPLPRHHERMALALAALSFIGIAILLYGLAVLRIWPVSPASRSRWARRPGSSIGWCGCTRIWAGSEEIADRDDAAAVAGHRPP